MLKSKFIKILFFSFVVISLALISLSSIVQLGLIDYDDRIKLVEKINRYVPATKKIISLNREVVEPYRQIPPKTINQLKIKGGEHKTGIWTSPFDWPVMAIHSILLPNYKVLTFGSFAIEDFDRSVDVRANKEITLTNGQKLFRDNGFIQYKEHNVNGGVDFAIWDPQKIPTFDNFEIIKKPILYDAFCTVVRVVDEETVLMLGGSFLIGGENPQDPQPLGMDTQNATTIFNPIKNSFTAGEKLKYKRWYGSVVRLADDRIVMVGGKDVNEEVGPSIIPEILEKDQNGIYRWKDLEGASSEEMFGVELSDEWSYPKSFLASDGNIFGISYNKLWVLNPNGNGSIKKVGELELKTGGGIRYLVNKENEPARDHSEHNHSDQNKVQQNLTLGVMSSGLGSTASALMIDKDRILLIGGDQTDGKILHRHAEANHADHNLREFFPSNEVTLIDISDTSKPLIKKMKGMYYPRSNADATILPNGNIFVNGGTSFDDTTFSVFTPEIYDQRKNEWTELAQSLVRRNYHSSSILLPDGRVLVAGGDVWNAEIFYPPYLFTIDWNGKTILAKRPKIKELKKNLKSRSEISLKVDSSQNISNINIISTGNTTHAQPTESKFLSLDFKVINETEIRFSIPDDKNIIQNGPYMIFAVNTSGTPSEGKIVILD
mgnify:CR=1 FL=1